MSSVIVRRLTDARRALYNVQNIIDPDKVLLANRRLIRAYLTQFSQQLRPVISLLPNVVRSDDLNVTREIRNIRTTCVSIHDALEDRAMSRDEAAQRTIDLIAQVRGVRRILKRSIADYSEKYYDVVTRPVKSRATPPELEPIIPPKASVRPSVPAATAAPIFKPVKKYRSFQEMRDDYDEFNRIMGEQYRLATGEKPPPPAEPETKPTTSTKPLKPAPQPHSGYAPDDDWWVDKPRTQEEIINPQHERQHDAAALRLQKIMRDVQKELPAHPKFTKNVPYRIMHHCPLLAVTRGFISDATWRNVGMRITRPLSPISAHIPGMHRISNTSVNSPLVIIHDQTLLALPLQMAQNTHAMQEFLTYDIPQIKQAFGNFMIMEIGGERHVARMDQGGYKHGVHKPQSDPRFHAPEERAEPAEKKKTKGKAPPKKRLTKAEREEQLKLRAERDQQRNLETERRIERNTEAQKVREREASQAVKRETKRVATFEAGRKYFFGNKNYPGVAWFWIIRLHESASAEQSMAQQLSRIHVTDINLPTADDMRKSTRLDIKSGPALVREKEKAASRGEQKMDRLARARQRLTGDIWQRFETLRDQQNRAIKKREEMERDLTSEQHVLQQHEVALRRINPADVAYEEKLELMGTIKSKIDTLEKELEHNKKMVGPLIKAQQNKLMEELKLIVSKKAAERRKKRQGL